MSPFAIYLKTVRLARGLKQKELALRLGYEPSYLSAVERGDKGVPKEDFVNRLIRGLNLDREEQETLYRALRMSRRTISIPSNASEQEYALFHSIEPQLGRLHPLQIELIKLALRLPAAFAVTRQPG